MTIKCKFKKKIRNLLKTKTKMNFTENNYRELAAFTALNGYYTIPILGLIGFCTNLICLLVIFSPRFRNRDKFYYVIVVNSIFYYNKY